ncbi:MAG: preprotein translocase subunit SecG [Woeseiaceae bacterium]
MQTPVLVVHTLIALAIVGLVLIQRGKGADAGAAFGSGASGTVFGSRGSTSFFSRATAILATAFFATSLTLAYLSSEQAGVTDSLMESMPAVETEEQSVIEDMPAADGVPALDGVESDAEDASIPNLDTDIDANVDADVPTIEPAIEPESEE